MEGLDYITSPYSIKRRAFFFYSFIFLVIFVNPLSALAYTYSDVEDFMSSHPAPSNCINWLEEVTIAQGSGYRVWRRCGAGTIRNKSYEFYDSPLGSGSCPYDGRSGVIACGFWNIYTQGPVRIDTCNWVGPYGRVVHRTVYCDGRIEDQIEMRSPGTPLHLGEFGTTSPCGGDRVSYFDTSCNAYDTLLKEFIPVEKCFNPLTGVYESCAQNCRDPVYKTEITEVCGNNIDDNCNGQRDEGCAKCVDADSDGSFAYDAVYCPEGNDCDDNDAAKNRRNEDGDEYSTCGGDCNDDPETGRDTYPGAKDKCDNVDNNCNMDVDEDCCEVGSVTVEPAWVWPNGTGGNAEAFLTVSLTRAAPFEGCMVNFSVEPYANSGGHLHDGRRPGGGVSPWEIGFLYGETGPKEAKYLSNFFSGREKIKAEIVDGRGDEAEVDVEVTGITAVLAGGYYNLKCNIENCSGYRHEDFYRVQPWVKGLFDRIAYLYHLRFQDSPLLVVTDGSLKSGGLYDYKNTWTSPHTYHRIGTDIDVRSKNVPFENRIELERTICKNGGFPNLEYPGGTNEHYHLYFYPYKNSHIRLCDKERR